MTLLWFTGGVTAALLAGVYLEPSRGLLLALGLGCLALWGIFAALKGQKRPKIALLGAGVALLWLLGYGALFHGPAEALEHRTVRLEAVVEDWPEATNYGYRVPVKAGEGEGRKVKALYYGAEEVAGLRPGDRFACIAHCSPVDRIRGQESLYYTSRGILLQIKGYGDLSVTPVEGIPVRYALPFLAGYLKDLLEEMYPPREAGFLQALLLGDKNGLSDTDTNNFNRIGLGHVVVISGMHVTFLLGLLSFFLRPRGKGSLLLLILLLAAFSGMTGNAPGTVRAVILSGVVLLGQYLGRETHPMVTLSLGLLFLLGMNPYAIGSAGLQFSFLSTAGIFLWGRPWAAKGLALLPKGWRKAAAPVVTMGAISLSSMLLTVPLSVLYFGRFSLLAPVANLLTGWAVSLMFAGGMLSLALGLLWLPLGQGLAALVCQPIDFFLWFGRWASRMDLAALSMDQGLYALWAGFVYLVAALYLFLPGKGKRPVIPLCACLVTLCLSVVLTTASARRAELAVSVLDVGQGQCVAVTSGAHGALVDCGGTTDPGDTAATWLQAQGRDRLDLLVLTHFHEDHAGGVEELLGRVHVDTLAIPDVEGDSQLRRAIEAAAAENGTEVCLLTEPARVTLGEAELTLFPPLPGSQDTNERCLAVLCAHEGWEALITGDMPREEEVRLAAWGVLPDCELLVVGHHGSRHSTSGELLAAVRPEYAVISVGYNGYGHPAEETLERLQDLALYRTDKDGTVTLYAP